LEEIVVNEFVYEKVLIGDITISKDLAIIACQIRQSLIAQLDEELQIPPDVLFKHLSFTHFHYPKNPS